MALFQSSFQGGPSFEVFSTQGSNPTANWKISPANAAKKVFDAKVKSYVYVLEPGASNFMQLPKDEKKSSMLRCVRARALVYLLLQPFVVYLTQSFLVLQLFLQERQGFSVELTYVGICRLLTVVARWCLWLQFP